MVTNRGITEVDRKILALLRSNARMTATAIGKTVGLSRSAVHQRIGRLERNGVIVGYTTLTAAVDEHRDLVAAIVLINLVKNQYADVAAALAGWPEVRSCWSIAGDHDMAVLVEVPAHHELMELTRRLSEITSIRDTVTHIALMTHFDRTPRST